jgi:hypothetical protein
VHENVKVTKILKKNLISEFPHMIAQSEPQIRGELFIRDVELIFQELGFGEVIFRGRKFLEERAFLMLFMGLHVCMLASDLGKIL